MDFNSEFGKIHPLNEKKIHFSCVTPKIYPNQPFWFPLPLHIREMFRKIIFILFFFLKTHSLL